MKSTRILTIISLILSVNISFIFAACKMLDPCVHFGGSKYNFTEAKASQIQSSIVPNVGQDPTPCCHECSQVSSCAVYDYEFNNGFDAVCTLYSLPDNLLAQNSIENNQWLLYLTRGDANRCVGFSYAKIGLFS
jgi:hypothetical protein